MTKEEQAYRLEASIRRQLEKRIPRSAIHDTLMRGTVGGNGKRVWIDLAPQDAADIGFKRIEAQI